jgi:hypothetical protein
VTLSNKNYRLLFVICALCHTLVRYDKCCYIECRYADSRGAIFVLIEEKKVVDFEQITSAFISVKCFSQQMYQFTYFGVIYSFFSWLNFMFFIGK